MTIRTLAAAALLAPALLGGCATRGDLQELHYELRELAVRQDSAFAAIERALQRGNEAALDSVAAIASQLFDLRGDLSNRLQGIQQQQLIMGELVGQSQHSLALLGEEINRQGRQIEQVSRRRPADTTAVDQEEDAEPADEAGDVMPDPAEEAFNSLIDLLDRGLTSSARRGLEMFLEEYPASEFAPAAYLNLAEMRALEDEVEGAIEAYAAIPDLFPDADEVPRALFQAGLLCLSIEDAARAREYLQWLVDDYPDHRLAPQARDQLEQIP